MRDGEADEGRQERITPLLGNAAAVGTIGRSGVPFERWKGRQVLDERILARSPSGTTSVCDSLSFAWRVVMITLVKNCDEFRPL